MPFLVDITKAMIHSKLKVIKMLLVPFACVFNSRQTNKRSTSEIYVPKPSHNFSKKLDPTKEL